ncbi:hypothetical protein ACR2E0_001699 [Phascolarctobacterium faecium]|uniref:hypothetical protein n=1 Tax=Phascolarctobacterium faecium TaxID=33025 RepID=UPI003F744B32
MKKNKSNVVNICLALLLLLQALLLPVICSAEPVYVITETELVTLEQNSNRQLELSSQLAKELQIAKERLKVSDQELTEAKLQKELLQKQLTELEASSKNQENLQKEILKSLPPSAPGVLREVGLKIDVDRYITGASYGVSRLIGSKYIGLRGEYDWKDKKAGMWLTYAY